MNLEISGQEKFFDYYEVEARNMVRMEECAELIQAISKMRRASRHGVVDKESDVYCNLVEEMADVLICIEQLKIEYEITDSRLQVMINKKVKRQEERLSKVLASPEQPKYAIERAMERCREKLSSEGAVQ